MKFFRFDRNFVMYSYGTSVLPKHLQGQPPTFRNGVEHYVEMHPNTYIHWVKNNRFSSRVEILNDICSTNHQTYPILHFIEQDLRARVSLKTLLKLIMSSTFVDGLSDRPLDYEFCKVGSGCFARFL